MDVNKKLNIFYKLKKKNTRKKQKLVGADGVLPISLQICCSRYQPTVVYVELRRTRVAKKHTKNKQRRQPISHDSHPITRSAQSATKNIPFDTWQRSGMARQLVLYGFGIISLRHVSWPSLYANSSDFLGLRMYSLLPLPSLSRRIWLPTVASATTDTFNRECNYSLFLSKEMY